MQIHKGYKLAIYPTAAQEARLWQIIGSCRFIWNHYLAERNAAYLERGERMHYADMCRHMTQFKKQEGLEWLDALPANPLHQTLRDLDVAFNRFFRKLSRFPGFKSRKDPTQSFRLPQHWRIRGDKIQTEKDFLLHARGTFPPDTAKLKRLTIKWEGGRWYASILTEQEIDPKLKTGDPVGIDLGLADLVTTSGGTRWPNLKARRTIQRTVKRASQNLSRKKKGSNRRANAKQKLARLHRKAANRRMNHLHQTTHRITSENQAVIVCEDLAVKNMMQNHRLAGSIADASWRELVRQLEYKQVWRGGSFAKIDRFFPSSKTCSECYFVLDSLPLKVREWTCPRCGVVHDRDVNAAKMILKQYRAEEQPGVEGKESSRRKPVMVAYPMKRRVSEG